jgi:hypothetical protein
LKKSQAPFGVYPDPRNNVRSPDSRNNIQNPNIFSRSQTLVEINKPLHMRIFKGSE